MAYKLWPLLLISTCTFLLVQSLPALHHLSKRSSQRYCGRNLVQVLALVCDGNYYDPSRKRNNYKEEVKIGNPLYEMDSSKNLDGDEYLDKKSAITFLKKNDFFDRDSRGVSDECCKKSCSFYELQAYCY